MIVPELLDAKAVAARYGVNEATARSYMRKMRHTEDPLRVTAQDMLAWDASRTIDPEAEKALKQKKKTRPIYVMPDDGWHIPKRKI